MTTNTTDSREPHGTIDRDDHADCDRDVCGAAWLLDREERWRQEVLTARREHAMWVEATYGGDGRTAHVVDDKWYRRVARAIDADWLSEAILDTQGSRDLATARWEALGIIERLGDDSWTPGVCGMCQHDRACHSSGGMCDGDGTVCHCSRFPDAPDFVFAKPEVSA